MKKIFLYSLFVLCFCLCIFAPLSAKADSITTGVITGSNVAFRKEADIDSKLIGRLSKGITVKILKTNVNAEWDKIQYDGKTGYVNRMYISWDSSLDAYKLNYIGTVVNCKKDVNVRGTPEANGKVLGAAKKGDKLSVIKKVYSKGWSQVKFNDKTGYISSKYLSIKPDVDDTKLISLSVSGGTLSPAFSPYEHGYVIKATSSSIKIKAKANEGIKVSINKTGKGSGTVKVASGGMKTIRISVGGKTAYSIYVTRNVLTYGTWNIKRGYGKLLMQGRFLYNQHPDIMGIQEVYRNYKSSNIIDNLTSLRTRSMTYTYFAKTIKYSAGGEYGIGLISRYKLSNKQIYSLNSSGYEKRALIKSVITVNGKKVSVYNTHFTHESAKVRAKQFAQVLSIMGKDTNKYKILTGDFNAKEPEFAAIKKKYNVIINSTTKYYDDTGTVFKNRYLDNIIVTKNIKVVNSRIVHVSLSDHYPVFAYLVLK